MYVVLLNFCNFFHVFLLVQTDKILLIAAVTDRGNQHSGYKSRFNNIEIIILSDFREEQLPAMMILS